MAIVSKKQYRTMQAVEHGWEPKGKAKGLTKAVAGEFIEKTNTPYSRMPERSPKMRHIQRRARREISSHQSSHSGKKSY